MVIFPPVLIILALQFALELQLLNTVFLNLYLLKQIKTLNRKSANIKLFYRQSKIPFLTLIILP